QECCTTQKANASRPLSASLCQPNGKWTQENKLLNPQKRKPESNKAMGKVKNQAKKRFGAGDQWKPGLLAIIVPATPDDNTCVVLTGRPNQSAAPMVAMAVISAAPPWP